jgi:hypothetical protein
MSNYLCAVSAVLAAVTTTGPLIGDTYTVTNIDDNGPGSFRQAILDANGHANSLNPGSAPDDIAFGISGSGVHTISPTSSLPTVTDPVIIDGYTQPGASANTLASRDDAVLVIELTGTNAGASVGGLSITAGQSTIRGLVINGFDRNGISINTNGSNMIAGNFIGTNSAGTAAIAITIMEL